jgi:hypothetical protein
MIDLDIIRLCIEMEKEERGKLDMLLKVLEMIK